MSDDELDPRLCTDSTGKYGPPETARLQQARPAYGIPREIIDALVLLGVLTERNREYVQRVHMDLNNQRYAKIEVDVPALEPPGVDDVLCVDCGKIGRAHV